LFGTLAFGSLAAGGCDVSYRVCSVLCGDAGCPAGLACAADGFYHAPGQDAQCAPAPGVGASGGGGGAGRGASGASGAGGRAAGGAGGAGGTNVPGSTPAALCKAARVECGPATAPDGGALDCGGCAGPSSCQAGRCTCTTDAWASAKLAPAPAEGAALTVTAWGETHVAVPDPVDRVLLLGRRPPAQGFGTFEPVDVVCAGSEELSGPTLASTADGVAHLVFCSQDADGNRAFRYITRAPGGAPVEATAPAGEAGAGPKLLAAEDGTLHLFYEQGPRIRYTRLPPGGAWTVPETVRADAFPMAAALDATTLVVAYRTTDGSSGLLRSSSGAQGPWRQVQLRGDAPVDLLQTFGFVRVALLADGGLVVGHRYCASSDAACGDSPECCNVDSYVASAEGEVRTFKRHVSRGRDSPFVDRRARSGVTRDAAGRAHLVSAWHEDAADGDRYEIRDEVYVDGAWQEAVPVASVPQGDAPFFPQILPTSSSRSVHVLFGDDLFERCY
jgi:hypothetical protein